MKLSVDAQQLGISDRTAWRWFRAGKVAGYQADTGTIIVTEPTVKATTTASHHKIAIYTRVSAAENKDNLEGQAKRLMDYCAAKGYQVTVVVKEIGSGVNDARPKRLKQLTDPTIGLIVVEHQDRLTRFGFNYIEQLLALRAAQLGYIRDKLKFKLDEHGIGYRSVQAAYSSQQCSQCGFTFPMNRRSQAEFCCLWCGFKANAAENAAQNIAERFGDDELNAVSFRAVETVLVTRFMRRLPVARSATAGLELQPELWLPRGKVMAALAPPSTVNQPGQDPCHSCL